MTPFVYARPTDASAAASLRSEAGSAFIAGGTTIVDLMRLGVESPATLIDLGALALSRVEENGAGLLIGALAKNSDVATNAIVKAKYPALSQALLSGASPQVRNMASMGGNLLQKTRCPYFRDAAVDCNKKKPGAGCPAMEGFNRSHAVLGTSAQCIATHPSDMSVALLALDAVIRVHGPTGERTIPLKDFHTAPGDHPEVETSLAPAELVTHIELPGTPFFAHSTYLKVRDRASFAFALASAAVALDLADGTIRAARVALGGVATKPWRSAEAENALVGKKPTADVFHAAATAAMHGAVPHKYNAFKVVLGERTLFRALTIAGGLS